MYKCYDKCTPEIESESEIKKDIEKESKSESKKGIFVHGTKWDRQGQFRIGIINNNKVIIKNLMNSKNSHQ